MKQKYNLLLAIILFTFLNCFAQPGSIDPTFNPLDSGCWKGNCLNNSVSETIIQKDGKILIAGGFTRFNGNKVNYIARFNSNGTPDNTFSVTGTGTNRAIDRMALQQDGKIVIIGGFITYNGISRNGIARLNANGSLDSTFNPGTGATNINNSTTFVVAVCIQSDGKIIISGQFDFYNGLSRKRIVRLNSDGSIDNTFNVGTGTVGFASTIVQQNDGKIIVGGNFSKYNGTAVYRIARINSDGSLDNTFVTGTSADDLVKKVTIQSDGKIIIGGAFHLYNGTSMNGIARLNTDGTLDPAFTVGTGFGTGTVNNMCIQNDGKIIIGGDFNSYNGTSINRIARLNTDGVLDNSFNPQSGPDNTISSVAFQNDGKIFIGGSFRSYNGTLRNFLARINADGAMDKTVFNVLGLGSNGSIFCSAVQKDGKIIIGGAFSSYNGIIKANIIRLNSDGTLDNTFNVGSGTDNWVRTIVLQSDGKILIGGSFKLYNGIAMSCLARLNMDGSLDATFNPNTINSSYEIESVSLQTDGKIVIGGGFSYKGAQNILRLHPNGSIDSTFNVGVGSDQYIAKTLIQSDGKIIIAGYLMQFNGTAKNYIARLNSNGTLDTAFKASTNQPIYSAALQSDGKIIISGKYNLCNGVSVNGIARLNTDGTFDATFNTGSGVNNSALDIVVQSNGKIILVGFFTTYNGALANHIACLNTDGSLDNTFVTGAGTDDFIVSASIQADGKIIIGGPFYSYNNTGRNGIARINYSTTTNINEYLSDNGMLIYPNPNTGEFNLKLDQQADVLISDVLGRVIVNRKVSAGLETFSITNEANGIYFMKLNFGSQQQIKKIIISK